MKTVNRVILSQAIRSDAPTVKGNDAQERTTQSADSLARKLVNASRTVRFYWWQFYFSGFSVARLGYL
ncbi:MAG: hypothetical protein MI864_10860 [Pseudomonadales bacterium]|uniref:Uncharacterized protein n=1 Tax=Oleiphilus messinensis TaxID=141451 RepID=A0A1Y0IFC7_9GAMM|nr:hypothetical protein [Oleiphilus messinensis]ARU58506.1 hypothetical protein OLMES_4510 [Oleiphilus messinensis]MCG8611024.1 hypothetical protein [Pseudomonadales bacterium]